MSLTLALNNALSGLNVNKQALMVLSQNIANVNTQGYSRKIIDQSAASLDGVGAGVRIEDVSRKIDAYLQRAVQMQYSSIGQSTAISDFADRLQVFLGQPGAANSLDTYVTSFFSSLQSLAETPERSSFRLNAVNAGVTIANQISSLADSVQDLRFQADREISQAVQDTNREIRELAAVNTSIANAVALGKSTAELLDKRDMLMQGLSEKLDVNFYFEMDGRVRLFTAGGQALLNETVYQLAYTPAASKQHFITGSSLNPIQVYRTDAAGNRIGTPQTLVTGGASAEVTTSMNSGTIKGLLEVRDSQLPDVLEQLDNLAAKLRDEMNALHNQGSGFPGASSLTGTRPVAAGDYTQWSGTVRIALLDRNGKPPAATYAGEEGGLRPLEIDLSTLDGGFGDGKPTVQAIINEINNYYGIPQNKVTLGNFNNIRLTSNSPKLPQVTNQFNFDFDIENISGQAGDFFVTNVQILDDTGFDLTAGTPVTSTIPSVNLAAGNTFVTQAGETVVTVNTNGAHGFVEGQRVYISDPGAPVDGIPAAEFNQFFTISNVTSTSFEITVGQSAAAGGTFGIANMTVNPKYATVEAGDYARTRANGTFTADLSANTTSNYYTIRVAVAADNEDGELTTSTIEYRIPNDQGNLLNHRYSARTSNGDGVTVQPEYANSYARAILVDEFGNELNKTNGAYNTDAAGYLKIQTDSGDYFVAIDSLDSTELGFPNNAPAVPGTNRGFSHFFELNNFFKSNIPTTTGDTVEGSALALAVEQRLRDNPNLITTGQLTRVPNSPDPTKPPYYTYERLIGDNALAQQMASLASVAVEFNAAGGLGVTNQSLNGYAAEILGYLAASNTTAASTKKNAETLLAGFTERLTAVSGVNLDEELANTVIYQNAYAASARLITITDELFETLLNT